MNDPKALAEIKKLASRGAVRFKGHAIKRMKERNATEEDVINSLVTAKQALKQAKGNWRVKGGVDLDGDDLTAIVDIEADLIIVTIF